MWVALGWERGRGGEEGEVTWLIPAVFGDRVGVTQEKGHGWHMAGYRDSIGTTQEKGCGRHMARCRVRVDVPRRRDTWPGMGMGSVSPRSRDTDGTQTDVMTGSVSPGEERLVAPRLVWGWCHPGEGV